MIESLFTLAVNREVCTINSQECKKCPYGTHVGTVNLPEEVVTPRELTLYLCDVWEKPLTDKRVKDGCIPGQKAECFLGQKIVAERVEIFLEGGRE